MIFKPWTIYYCDFLKGEKRPGDFFSGDKSIAFGLVLNKEGNPVRYGLMDVRNNENRRKLLIKCMNNTLNVLEKFGETYNYDIDSPTGEMLNSIKELKKFEVVEVNEENYHDYKKQYENA